MCWSDVKMGRNKVARALNAVTVATGVPAQLVSININRAAVVVAARPSEILTATDAVYVYGDSPVGPVLAVLTAENPSAILDVERYGQGITGNVWVASDSAGGVQVQSSELYWNKEPGDQ